MGIVTRLVKPAEVESTLKELAGTAIDKYAGRETPEKFDALVKLGRAENVSRLLSGQLPEHAPADLAAKTAKIIGYKAPLALKLANEIIDAQAGLSMADAVEVELGRLSEIFSTADALEGLSSAGRKRPEFTGR